MSDAAFWAEVRSDFLIEPNLIYMNNGSLGPMPLAVVEANDRVTRQLAANPIDFHRAEEREAVRGRLADFVGADPDALAITRSTTEGMHLFAHGIDWQPGEEVILCSHEHPGGYGAYQSLEARRGIKIRWIDLPTPPASAEEILDRYRQAITPRTRLIVASHIVFVTGLVMPIRELAELAHAQGVLLSVDGAHALGMLPLDLKALDCDHYAASGQKWLLGGTGTGFSFLRAELQDRVWPLFGFAADRIGARKYEMSGQNNLPSVAGLDAALQFQQAIGPARIAERVGALAGQLRAGLAFIPGVKLWTPAEASLAAGLTTFTVGSLPSRQVAKVVRELAGIYILPMPVGDLNAVRVSLHCYNSPAEVEQLLTTIRHLAENEFDFL